MSGPIRTITIDDTPQPNNNFLVTITLPVWISSIPPGVSLDKVAEVLTHSRWEEGRYPFNEEMLHRGLREVIRDAIGEVLTAQLHEHYGNEMVPSDNGETARWYLEAQKIKNAYVATNGSIKAAKFEQECENCRGDGYIRVYDDGFPAKKTCEACGGTGVEK